jgi:hypothetical protein
MIVSLLIFKSSGLRNNALIPKNLGGKNFEKTSIN